MQQLKDKRLSISSQVSSQNRLSSAEKRKKLEQSVNDFKKSLESSRQQYHKTHQQFYHKKQNYNKNKDANISLQQLIPQQKHKQEPIISLAEIPKQQHENNDDKSQEVIVNDKEQPIVIVQPIPTLNLQQPFKQSSVQKQIPIETITQPKSIQNIQLPKQTIIPQINMVNQKHDNKEIPNIQINQQSQIQSNNSSAIFFTSQFKEYFNKVQQQHPINVQNHQEESIPQIILSQRQHTLNPIKSQQSLMISNESSVKQPSVKPTSPKQLGENESFKYSMNESAVKDILNNKLQKELYLDNNFFKFEQLLKISEKLLKKNWIQELMLLAKYKHLKSKVRKRQLRQYFDQFIIYKQYRFYIVKNQIKSVNHYKALEDKRTKNIFAHWKQIILQKQYQVNKYRKQKEQVIRNNCFRVFKMLWHQKKVEKQIDLYYITKIFSKLKQAIKQQVKQYEHISNKFYYKNSRKRFFYLFLEGISNLQKIRYQQQLAQHHYGNNLLMKSLQAWKLILNSQPKYISLSLTTKDVFKQTNDHRWIHTKTFDFKPS